MAAMITPVSTPKTRLHSPASGYGILRSAIGELREEVTAIRQCLADAGLLRTETFLAQLHRRKFAKMCRVHPCTWDSSMLSALGSNELLGLTVLNYAGMLSVNTLRCTSRSLLCIVDLVGAPLADSLTRLYVCGGADGSRALSSVERFDPQLGTWESVAPMTQPRAAAASAILGGRLYVCGGSDGQRELSDVERFTPLVNETLDSVGVWEPVPPLLEPRADASAGVINGRLCVCAGCYLQNVWGSAESFNPALGTWEALRSMRQPRSEACAATVQGYLYVCGGNGDGHNREALNSVEIFDPAGNWQAMPPLLNHRYGAAAVVLSNRLYIYGGHNGREYLTSAERFDPAIGTWEFIAPLLRPRAGMAAAALCGDIYLCGGYDGAAVRVVERCRNPEAVGAVWEVLAPLSQDRASAVTAAMVG